MYPINDIKSVSDEVLTKSIALYCAGFPLFLIAKHFEVDHGKLHYRLYKSTRWNYYKASNASNKLFPRPKDAEIDYYLKNIYA